jgi:hypothetical protein
MFAAALHSWRPFLHPQPEDAPCCGDRDPPDMANEAQFKQKTNPRNEWRMKTVETKSKKRTKRGKMRYRQRPEHLKIYIKRKERKRTEYVEERGKDG